jgi:hypothetical protein
LVFFPKQKNWQKIYLEDLFPVDDLSPDFEELFEELLPLVDLESLVDSLSAFFITVNFELIIISKLLHSEQRLLHYSPI